MRDDCECGCGKIPRLGRRYCQGHADLGLEKRYRVISVTGFPIRPEATVTSTITQPGTSFSIIDTCWGNREVRRFYAPDRQGPGAPTLEARRREARRTCAAMNADERAWEIEQGVVAV